jgi:hypothetical protein
LGGNVVSYTADRDAMEAITLAAVEQERFMRQSGYMGDPTHGTPRPYGL